MDVSSILKNKYVRSVFGVAMIFVAVGLYVQGIFESSIGSPWLLLGSPALIAVGVFIFGLGVFTPLDTDADVTDVRLDGPGKTTDSPKRRVWLKHQAHKAKWVTLWMSTLIVVSIAFFISNHLGRITDGDKVGFQWQSHAERTAGKAFYITSADETISDSLITVASRSGVTLDELVDFNSGIELMISTTNGAGESQDADVQDAPSNGGGTIPSQEESSESDEASNPDSTDGESTEGTAGNIDSTQPGMSAVPINEVAEQFAGSRLLPDQVLHIPVQTRDDPRLWLDWILASLIGVAAYLLLQAGRHYREIPLGGGNFSGEIIWYFAQIITGPLVAFVVLFILTQVDISVLGSGAEDALSINFSEFAPDVLVMIAFMLGFYSRTARELLDQIAKSVFRNAYLAANGNFEITTGDRKNEVVSEGSLQLETDPATSVTWQASEGTIDTAGVYTAPKVEDKPRDVIVTAVAVGGIGSTAARVIRVVPHLFSVKFENSNQSNEVKPGESVGITIDPLPPESEHSNIAWAVRSPTPEVTLDKERGKTVALLIPTGSSAGTEAIVTATYMGHSQSLSVTIIKGFAGVAANIDGEKVAQDQAVPPNTKIDFSVLHNLSAEEAAKIVWTIAPADGNEFSWDDPNKKGPENRGQVEQNASPGKEVKIIARHEESEVYFGFLVGTS